MSKEISKFHVKFSGKIMSTGVSTKKEEYERWIFFSVLEVTGESRWARHVYITGSRPLAKSYANEMNWSERIHVQGNLLC